MTYFMRHIPVYYYIGTILAFLGGMFTGLKVTPPFVFSSFSFLDGFQAAVNLLPILWGYISLFVFGAVALFTFVQFAVLDLDHNSRRRMAEEGLRYRRLVLTGAVAGAAWGFAEAFRALTTYRWGSFGADEIIMFGITVLFLLGMAGVAYTMLNILRRENPA